MNLADESRIHALIARLCDAELTKAEAQELSQLLNHDPQAIQEYVDLTGIEFHLHRKMWVPLQTSAVSEHQLHRILSIGEQSNSQVLRNSILFRHRKSLFLWRRVAAGEPYDPLPVVRLFTPDAHAIWLLASLDPADGDTAWGVMDVGIGMPELGRIKLSDLASIVGPNKQPVMRDLYFQAVRPLSEYLRLAQENGSIVD